MTRHELNQIYYIEKEIEMWRRELDKIRDLQAPKMDGMPKGTDVSDSTSLKGIKAAEITETIDGLLLELERKKIEIYQYIETVDDSLIRQIIVYRCVELNTWEQVSIKIGGGNTGESVRKAFNRYMDREESEKLGE